MTTGETVRISPPRPETLRLVPWQHLNHWQHDDHPQRPETQPVDLRQLSSVLNPVSSAGDLERRSILALRKGRKQRHCATSIFPCLSLWWPTLNGKKLNRGMDQRCKFLVFYGKEKTKNEKTRLPESHEPRSTGPVDANGPSAKGCPPTCTMSAKPANNNLSWLIDLMFD